MALQFSDLDEFILSRDHDYGDGVVPKDTVLIVLEARKNLQDEQEIRIAPKNDLKKFFRDAWEQEMWFPTSGLPVRDVITEE